MSSETWLKNMTLENWNMTKDLGYLVQIKLTAEQAGDLIDIWQDGWYDYELYPSNSDAVAVCAELFLSGYESRYYYVEDWIEPDYMIRIGMNIGF